MKLSDLTIMIKNISIRIALEHHIEETIDKRGLQLRVGVSTRSYRGSEKDTHFFDQSFTWTEMQDLKKCDDKMDKWVNAINYMSAKLNSERIPKPIYSKK